MGNESFDALLAGLHAALRTAQDALARRSAGSEEPGPGPCLVFALPLGDEAEPQEAEEPRGTACGSPGAPCRLLSLPLASFRQRCALQVAQLSLSFACELRRDFLPGPHRVYTLVIADTDDEPLFGGARRRMDILLGGAVQPAGEVRLEGRTLLEFPAAPGGGQDGAEGRGVTGAKARPTLLARLLGAVQECFRPRGYVLSEEQSRQVRRLLEQLENEAAPPDGNAPL